MIFLDVLAMARYCENQNSAVLAVCLTLCSKLWNPISKWGNCVVGGSSKRHGNYEDIYIYVCIFKIRAHQMHEANANSSEGDKDYSSKRLFNAILQTMDK